jgi:hypothetical protein
MTLCFFVSSFIILTQVCANDIFSVTFPAPVKQTYIGVQKALKTCDTQSKESSINGQIDQKESLFQSKVAYLNKIRFLKIEQNFRHTILHNLG